MAEITNKPYINVLYINEGPKEKKQKSNQRIDDPFPEFLKVFNQSISSLAIAPPSLKTRGRCKLVAYIFQNYLDCVFSSFSSEEIRSLAELLNSLNVLPKARPISGSFDGPKIIRAMTKTNISPGTPIFCNIAYPP
jgi:hypothetical protein